MNITPSKKNSVFGKASLILGVYSIVISSVITELCSFFIPNTDTSIENVGAFTLILIIPAFIGCIFGLRGLMQPNTKKEYACIGLAVNGLILSMSLFYFIVAIMLNNIDTSYL